MWVPIAIMVLVLVLVEGDVGWVASLRPSSKPTGPGPPPPRVKCAATGRGRGPRTGRGTRGSPIPCPTAADPTPQEPQSSRGEGGEKTGGDRVGEVQFYTRENPISRWPDKFASANLFYIR